MQRAVLRGSTNTLDDLAAAFAYTHGAAADAALPALRRLPAAACTAFASAEPSTTPPKFIKDETYSLQ